MDKFSGKNVWFMKSGSWSLLMRSFRALIVFDIAHQVAVASTKYSLFSRRVQNVAIIGGGAAGLITAKVFQQTGFKITIFEQTGYFGGVWQYGIQSNPMYRTLRTNLPTEIMSVSYEDPFILSKNDVARSCDNDDLTSYASHDEVMLYLKNFTDKYSLQKHVQFNSTVVKVERSTNSWTLYHQRSPGSRDECNGVESAIVATEFDAVIVCNGHFSKPFIPTAVQGLAGYTGLSMHSIRYDSLKEDPSLLAGKKVLVVGGKSSATDMAREILLSGVAAEVRISDRNIDTSYGIMYSDGAAISVDAAGRLPRDVHAYVFHPSIRFITEGSRTVTFADGSSADIDMILWCTGYLYDYPFLHNTQQCGDVCIGNEKEEKEGDEEVNGGAAEAVGIHLEAGKRLRGLHLKMIHQEEPTMAFIGLPFSVVPFPLFYFQARLLAALYKGRVSLPAIEERRRLMREEEDELHRRGLFYEKYHYLGGAAQWDYCRALAELFAPSIESSSSMEGEGESARLQAYVTMLQQIYEDNSARRPPFTGAPDAYRSRRYRIDWSSFDWELLSS